MPDTKPQACPKCGRPAHTNFDLSGDLYSCITHMDAKIATLKAQGYEQTGVVMAAKDGQRCIVDMGAVRHFSIGDWWDLMHPTQDAAPDPGEGWRCNFPGCRCPAEYPGHTHDTGSPDEMSFASRRVEPEQPLSLDDKINKASDELMDEMLAELPAAPDPGEGWLDEAVVTASVLAGFHLRELEKQEQGWEDRPLKRLEDSGKLYEPKLVQLHTVLPSFPGFMGFVYSADSTDGLSLHPCRWRDDQIEFPVAVRFKKEVRA